MCLRGELLSRICLNLLLIYVHLRLSPLVIANSVSCLPRKNGKGLITRKCSSSPCLTVLLTCSPLGWTCTSGTILLSAHRFLVYSELVGFKNWLHVSLTHLLLSTTHPPIALLMTIQLPSRLIKACMLMQLMKSSFSTVCTACYTLNFVLTWRRFSHYCPQLDELRRARSFAIHPYSQRSQVPFFGARAICNKCSISTYASLIFLLFKC